jgi:hypothetical protein
MLLILLQKQNKDGGMNYEYENYSVFFKHSSSLQQEDTGLNTVGIKVRITK